MADNIYLLETRLSPQQQAALTKVREITTQHGLTVFLVGGSVRDLISGTAVRDLDIAVQGDARGIRRDLEAAGAVVDGNSDLWQALFLTFPGGVRVEVSSTLSVTYPKPGKPVVAPATILDDLRRRDFTVNAMALSLNEGSYGLLMDPLNGVADIENRQLRLVSNYGFIEAPALILRAARFMARLGWTLEDKTKTRYETGREEGYLAALDDYHRGYEAEELFHEEDPLRIMRRLEEEGWLKELSPALSPTKANAAELSRLYDTAAQLQVQGIHPDPSTLGFPLLTAKLTTDEAQALKRSFPRQGFVREIDALEAAGKNFVAQLTGKANAQPSQAYRFIRSAAPEAVLWATFYSKSSAVQQKLKSFGTDWPQARQRIPYATMQEMRITPDLPGYDDLVEQLFFEIMDGHLDTPEAVTAFLEPHSPPAPPPPVSLRRPRASKKEAKSSRSRKKGQAVVADPDADLDQVSVEDTAPDEDTAMPDRQITTPEAPQVPAAKAIEPQPKAVRPAKSKAPRAEVPPTPVPSLKVKKTVPEPPAASEPKASKAATKTVQAPVAAAPAKKAKPASPPPAASKQVAGKGSSAAQKTSKPAAAPPERPAKKTVPAKAPVQVAPPAKSKAVVAKGIPAKPAKKVAVKTPPKRK